nr:integrin alpha [Candidatus Kerfeldbacteria bacterium]
MVHLNTQLKKGLVFAAIVFTVCILFSPAAHASTSLAEFKAMISDTSDVNYAGSVVASAGDVNNDGYDDFLVGADGNDEVATNAGAVYLIYGESSQLTSASLSTAIQFTGEVSEDYAGIAFSTAGDVNNDGYDDILIGAAFNDDSGSNAGAVYLIYGESSQLISSSLSTAIQFTGEAINDRAGLSVSSAGDVNNDGYDDILIGAYLNDDSGSNAGAVYLIYGQSSQLTSSSLSTAIQFTGEVEGDVAGYSVSAAGDVNNDGYDDILIGAYLNDDSGSNAGAVYLIYGESSQLTSASLSTAVQFTGEADGDAAGYSVSSAGDVNNDGYDDILIGAYLNDDIISGFGNSGAAYLIYGESSRLASASLSAAVKFTGEAMEDYAGISVSSAGDVNNDGYDDILIGAYLNDGSGTDAGAAYLIYGQSSQLTSASLSTAVQFTGEAAGDVAGYSVSAAGDVNGDGFDDVLIRGDVGQQLYLGYLYIDSDGDGMAGTSGVFSGLDSNDDDYDNDGLEFENDCDDTDDTVGGRTTYYA